MSDKARLAGGKSAMDIHSREMTERNVAARNELKVDR